MGNSFSQFVKQLNNENLRVFLGIGVNSDPKGEVILGVVIIDPFEETRTGDLKKSTHLPDEPEMSDTACITKVRMKTWLLQRRPAGDFGLAA